MTLSLSKVAVIPETETTPIKLIFTSTPEDLSTHHLFHSLMSNKKYYPEIASKITIEEKRFIPPTAVLNTIPNEESYTFREIKLLSKKYNYKPVLVINSYHADFLETTKNHSRRTWRLTGLDSTKFPHFIHNKQTDSLYTLSEEMLKHIEDRRGEYKRGLLRRHYFVITFSISEYTNIEKLLTILDRDNHTELVSSIRYSWADYFAPYKTSKQIETTLDCSKYSKGVLFFQEEKKPTPSNEVPFLGRLIL